MNEQQQMQALLAFAHSWPFLLSLIMAAIYRRQLIHKLSYIVVSVLVSFGIANIVGRLMIRYVQVPTHGSSSEQIFRASQLGLLYSQTAALVLGIALAIWLVRFFKEPRAL